MAVHVIHHSDPDGWASAFAAYVKYGDTAKYYGMYSYKDPFPIDIETLTNEDEVYILDFTFHHSVLTTIKNKCKKLLVIDHHASSCEYLLTIKELESNIKYDPSVAACISSWRYFNSQEILPLFLYIDDYDRYINRYNVSFGLNEIINSQIRNNFKLWHSLVNDNEYFMNKLNEAMAISEYATNTVCNAVKSYKDKIFKLLNYKVALINTTTLPNEITANLYNYLDIDFAIYYHVKSNGNIKFGLRANNGRDIDVSAIAALFGGGGHSKASGFELPLNKGMDLLKEIYSNEQN